MARSVQLWALFITGLLQILYVRSYLQSYLFSVLSIALESPEFLSRDKGQSKIEYLREYLLTSLKYIMVVAIQLVVLPMILLTTVIILNTRAQDYRFITPFMETVHNDLPVLSQIYSVINFNLWTELDRGHLQYFVGEILTFLSYWMCLAMTVLNIFALIYHDILEKNNAREQDKRRSRRESSYT